MKKFSLILLVTILVFSTVLTGCGYETLADARARNNTEATIPTETQTIESNTFQIGNLEFTLDSDMFLKKNSDCEYTVTLVQGESYVIMSVVDVSSLYGDELDALVESQHTSLKEEFKYLYGETDLDIKICDFDTIAESYVVIEDKGMRGHIDISFTDSWYAYTFQALANIADDDDAFDFGEYYGEFLSTANYIGKPYRDVELTDNTSNSSLTTYPLNSDSTYTELAAELPDHIYTTRGYENGLAGTIYRITGTAEDYSTRSSDDFVSEGLVVSTDKGNVLIINEYKSIYNATLLEFGAEFTKAYYPYDVDNFIFPDVGETAHFIVVYLGYSETEGMAAFTLGANPAIFQMLEYEDPTINYSSNTNNDESISSAQPTESPTEEPTETIPVGTDYVLNTNTHKFHHPSCSSVADIKENNKQTYTGTRDELIAQGYAPCGRCDP